MKIKDFLLCSIMSVSPTLGTKILYRRRLKTKLNLKNPETFNEKIQWLKLNVYSKDIKYTMCADKLLVRKYVESVGCKEILNKLYHTYDNVKQIDWEELPNQFVLKWNFGCGLNIICPDKGKVSEADTKKKLSKWRKNKFYLKTGELHYKKIKKKIICEEYLCDKKTNSLDDYKVYCFDGKVDSIMVCIGRNEGPPKFYYFDKNWKLLKEHSYDGMNSKNIDIEKPTVLSKLIYYAEKLSCDFPFVRVDLYVANDKIYFGELTFTPAAGLDTEKTKIADKEQSKKIIIDKYRSRK